MMEDFERDRRRVIRMLVLSRRCISALRRGDWNTFTRADQERSRLYVRLLPFWANEYLRRARLLPAELPRMNEAARNKEDR